MASRELRGRRAGAMFWPLADFFRKRPDSVWTPREISFERNARFKAGGHRWAMQCSLGLRLQRAEASVMIINVDRGVTERLTPRSTGLAFMDQVEQRLKQLGYGGHWDGAFATFGGLTAHFTKELRSTGAVLREWKALGGLVFGVRAVS